MVAVGTAQIRRNHHQRGRFRKRLGSLPPLLERLGGELDSRRAARAIAAFFVVVVIGTAGYVVLGFGLLDALYQTVTTITTVGFREVHPPTRQGRFSRSP